ncbi:MAG: type II toxin-antitoxin system VapC family toxin [Verrucomicrobiae bacterium]|nr:type II toxin-antitoxin system VapC family toxin [Verrucomicrobiae bacterium]
MMLLDVNILVHLHREDADQHDAIRDWIGATLVGHRRIAVTDLALSGCMRVVTHPKVFKQPSPLHLALQFVEEFRSHSRIHVLNPGPGHWERFIELCRKVDARGNLVPDAYHAALAMEQDCEWISLDRGFARFPGLCWRHPLD